MSKLNNEWRTIEKHLIIYNGVNRICHRLECHCINFDYCKHENDIMWNNIFEQELFDIDSHIGKDDFTLDAWLKYQKIMNTRPKKDNTRYISRTFCNYAKEKILGKLRDCYG